MNRRSWFQMVTAGSCWLFFPSTGRAQSGAVASLKEQLESELRARRPEEFAFIAQVVGLVDNGTLPLDLVQSTFLWARKKRPYPFVYFERAMRERAAEIGVSL